MDIKTEPPPEDYAEELRLFDLGELDQAVWAKHLVEAEGDAEKAKWRYIKERVLTAPVRREEQWRQETLAAEAAKKGREAAWENRLRKEDKIASIALLGFFAVLAAVILLAINSK